MIPYVKGPVPSIINYQGPFLNYYSCYFPRHKCSQTSGSTLATFGTEWMFSAAKQRFLESGLSPFFNLWIEQMVLIS